MTDIPMTDRNALADAISAELQSAGTSAPEAAPAPVAAAPAEEKEVAPPPAAAPATVEAEVAPPPEPQKLTLTDKSVVIDPATGEEKTWGEIKAERLRHADYTKKRMADAEAKRAWEEQKAKWEIEQAELRAKAAAAAVQDDLPADDPYAQRIKAIEAFNAAQAARFAAEQQRLEAERIATAQAQLAVEEKRMADELKFSEREVALAEAEYMRRVQSGEQVTLYAVAQEFAEYKAELKKAAEREFKEKHIVSSPAAAAAIPASGVAETPVPLPGSRGIVDAVREELASLIGR